ncbi:MAG TPA: alkaline phosphatase family protein [Victivallales bacterium]|nr:alkaline phosphatase family protein [Victivallales bacterium]
MIISKRFFKRCIQVFSFFLFAGVMFQINAGTAKKVLIIGIDGCRPDALKIAKTPVIDSLMKDGAYCFNSWTDKISDSGPCWTAMLTGVWHEKNGVTSNEYKNMKIDKYPHFFHYLKQLNPNIKTVSLVHWGPINKILQKGDADIAKSYDSDRKVADAVAELLKKDNPDVVFVQFDDVDHAGHAHGFTPINPDYIKTIEKEDTNIGIILNALRARKKFKNEDWLILISPDHGGTATGGHGGNSPQERNIFFIANGKSVVKGEIKKPVKVIDIAATAMKYLGYMSKNIDGQPRAVKTGNEKKI